jgi:transaldolase
VTSRTSTSAISNLQTLSTNTGRINEVLVSVANAKDVNSVAKAIKKALPGATVLTSASLADQVTGSLSNARKLANDLGGCPGLGGPAGRVPHRRTA